MIYKNYQDKKLSLLGFGAMRLPLLEDGEINEPLVFDMVDYAIDHGVNYFDTAYPYHKGESERVIGRALARYPRDTFYLATKYPGHQISESYDPAAIFEEQLKKCGVEYFDFYLLHNVYENSIQTYLDPKWGIVDYFKEQKRLGRIKHLGFSCHGRLETIKEFLDACGDDMEFCQIQLNYLDWTLQGAKEKYEYLTEKGIPVWVMEPVRGGKLAKLPEKQENELLKLRKSESIPAWCFRFLQELPNVTMVLSGMSDLNQMKDNVSTFEEYRNLSEEEMEMLLNIAEDMKDSIPCTACRYCCDGCPQQIDIPLMIASYNDLRFAPSFTAAMGLDTIPEDQKPAACIACGKCKEICPQGIDIPKVMEEFAEILSKMPSWEQMCKERAKEQR